MASQMPTACHLLESGASNIDAKKPRWVLVRTDSLVMARNPQT